MKEPKKFVFYVVIDTRDGEILRFFMKRPWARDWINLYPEFKKEYRIRRAKGVLFDK